ncbi:hypothetical protein [Streptomyces sp. NPDC053079]|uniref:hypothetical protein n=1 Tax=Streptomyces sp. NPDC053079 TaxID=3365697 RepID=UPI0037CE2BE8
MDQGVATVWAAGIGVAGLVLGTLGGAFAGAATSRRQARDQAKEQGEVELAHWLRAQRQAAYTTVISISQRLMDEARPLIKYERLDKLGEEERRDAWSKLTPVLNELRRASAAVAVVGPDEMANLAEGLPQTAAVLAAHAKPRDPYDTPGALSYNAAVDAHLRQLDAFVTEARGVIGAAAS